MDSLVPAPRLSRRPLPARQTTMSTSSAPPGLSLGFTMTWTSPSQKVRSADLVAAFPCDSLDTRVPGRTFTCVLSSRESSEFHTLQFEHLQTRLQDRTAAWPRWVILVRRDSTRNAMAEIHTG